MSRCFTIIACTVVLLTGCAQPQMPMDFQKPSPAPEMAKLAVFLGEWEGTAKFDEATAEMMKSFMPEGEEMPSSFAGASSFEWALEGMFLKGEGWHEMGEDQKVHYVEVWKWDPKAKKYRTWFFSDWGESGSGWATWCNDDKGLCFTAEMKDAAGARAKGNGCIRFVDDKTFEWTWNEKRGGMKMGFSGTSKRKG